MNVLRVGDRVKVVSWHHRFAGQRGTLQAICAAPFDDMARVLFDPLLRRRKGIVGMIPLDRLLIVTEEK